MKEKLMIFDPKTGEITGAINEGDRIVRKKQDEYNSTYVLKFNKEQGFVKFYNGAVDELYKVLDKREFAVIMRLSEYAGYDDCIIRNGRKLLNMQDISDCLEVPYGTIRKVIPSLISKGILGSCMVGNVDDNTQITRCYIMNPYLIFRGKNIVKETLGLFENSGWKERLAAVKEKYKAI